MVEASVEEPGEAWPRDRGRVSPSVGRGRARPKAGKPKGEEVSRTGLTRQGYREGREVDRWDWGGQPRRDAASKEVEYRRRGREESQGLRQQL